MAPVGAFSVLLPAGTVLEPPALVAEIVNRKGVVATGRTAERLRRVMPLRRGRAGMRNPAARLRAFRGHARKLEAGHLKRGLFHGLGRGGDRFPNNSGGFLPPGSPGEPAGRILARFHALISSARRRWKVGHGAVGSVVTLDAVPHLGHILNTLI